MKNKIHQIKLKHVTLGLASLVFLSHSINVLAIGNPLSGSRPLGFFDGMADEGEVPPYILACLKDRSKCQKNGSSAAVPSIDVPSGDSSMVRAGGGLHRTTRFTGTGLEREPSYPAAVKSDISGLTLQDCPDGLCVKSALDRVRADSQRNYDTTELALAAAEIVNELVAINEGWRLDNVSLPNAGIVPVYGMTAAGAQGRVRQLQTDWAKVTSKTYNEDQSSYRTGADIIAASPVLQLIEARFDIEKQIFDIRLNEELGPRGQHSRP